MALLQGELTLTYGELHELSSQAGQALNGALDPATPVGYLGRNCLELWVLWFGAGKSGRPFVPLNWRLAPRELAALLEDSGVGLVVVEVEFADQVQLALDLMEHPVSMLPLAPEATGGTGLRDWQAGYPTEDPAAEVFGHDAALIAYTSGTTGRPKGALTTHESFSFSFLSDELEPTISWDRDYVALMVMPNFHLAGTWVSLPALYQGASLAVVPAFEPAAVLDAVDRYQPTFMCLVPTAIQFLLDHERARRTDFSRLKTVVYAGSSINASTIRKALDILDCDLRQFLGTTETYIISILRPEDHDLDRPELLASCGKPIPLVEVQITDPDGNEVPDGQVGELRVHTPMLMAGYLNKPEETANAVENHWYRTGDVGYRNPEGYLFLVDRAKDMVVTGGENVYSIEVERAVASFPGVSQVAVVGTPDNRWGEVVTAYIVVDPGAQLDAGALQEHCRSLIAAYKVPRIVNVVDDLPLTPSGKIRKADIRVQAAEAATTGR
ncbi:class I adenylate-forming enzyme family protein [Citricoccus parietis]|uniref:Class I adenylate-forming enzyme family protein n=1 Tax=Citricoccus parietis TaxID=592307 RepID=A0ABV5G1B2_9MICC